MDKSIYYDISKILSYNALFNFVIGARGLGKTYAMKKYGIMNYLKKGEQFFLLRRTDVELKDAVDSFWDDMGEVLPKEYKGRNYGNKIQIAEVDINEDGEEVVIGKWVTIGFTGYLSNARRKKSVSYSKVSIILFDEFLIDERGIGKYQTDEVDVFLGMYETIARMRDVQVLFMANAMSTTNPYFIYFNLVVPKTKTGIKRIKDDIVIEVCQNEAFKEAKKQTRFGQLIAGTEFEKHAVENEFIYETEYLIEKKTGAAFYEFTLIIDKKSYGIYRDNKECKIFVSYDIDPKFRICFTYKTGQPSSMIFKNRTRYVIINDFVTNFEMGNVYFESQTIKKEMMEFMRRIM